MAYYLMSQDYNNGNAPGMMCLNRAALLGASGAVVLGPPRLARSRRGTGFPVYPEVPRFLIDPKLGRRVRDLELCEEFWLVSAALKAVFEAVDEEAFAFCACETVLPDGAAGPERWLCDVLPLLDAVDEARSTVRVKTEGEWRGYQFLSNTSLVFRPEIVGTRHVFRLLHQWPTIICDDVLRKACKTARMKGILFRAAAPA